MSKPVILITGGAGFIGANAAERWLAKGWDVRVFDDLSRPGVETNIAWLRRRGADFTRGDVRDAGAVNRWCKRSGGRARVLLHLAAQVAVTTSVTDPRPDFEVNALGSFNVLEAARALRPMPFTLYSSTNKVYGGMEETRVRRRGDRYEFSTLPQGVPETQPLDFHSPYGCSKGAADQYFRDYHRIYGLPSVVFRQSCVYGRHQHGNEDQGWVAHLMRAVIDGRPITVYGDGRQVRDVLFCDDLINVFEVAYARRGRSAGRVYNIGGGAANTLSLRELIDWMSRRTGRKVVVRRGDWRPGDQRVYVSDIALARRELGWRPKIGVSSGLERLWAWLSR